MHIRKIQLTHFIYQILQMTSFRMAIVILGVCRNIFEICPLKRTDLNSMELGGLIHFTLILLSPILKQLAMAGSDEDS